MITIVTDSKINNGKPSVKTNGPKYVTVKAIESFIAGGVDDAEIMAELNITQEAIDIVRAAHCA